MKILIVDLNIKLDGHKFGFVDQLIQYINTSNTKGAEIYILSNRVDQSFTSSSEVRMITADSEKWKSKTGVNLYAGQWDLIETTATELSINKVILMEYDLYQAELGKKRMFPFQVSGIWFRPYVRQQNLSSKTKDKLLFQIQQKKKRALFAWSMRNQSVREVFILNDQKTVDQLNKKYKNRLSYLADPVFEINCSDAIDIRAKYSIDPEKKILLLFGCIDERKNVLNTLKALSQLTKNEQKQVCLLMVGKVMPHYEIELNKFKEQHSYDFQWVTQNEFVSDCEMQALFAQCDLVLRMNVNFFASSGIIGFAAKYNKASIVSNYGIVAELTQNYKLGSLVDPMDVESISKLFSDYLNGRLNMKIEGQAYYQKHSLEAYASTLLGLDH